MCEEGCTCPDGEVLHNLKCISIEECPCFLNGQQYANGEILKKDCNHWWYLIQIVCFNINKTDFEFVFSTCLSSKWECTKYSCSQTCSTFADSHYETFDRKAFDFFGECAYVLAEDFCGTDNGSFRVIIENVPCDAGGIICSRAVKVWHIFYSQNS